MNNQETIPIPVEIAYANRHSQKVIAIQIEPQSSLLQAIQQSKILTIFPEIELQHVQVGVWGQIKPLTTRVNAGDRIEIYRPLLADPNQNRLKRAKLSLKK